MSRLVERYPQALRFPSSNKEVSDAVLLKQIEPYLGWVLAEIDTETTDVLISDANSTAEKRAQHLILLSGRAVSLWLKYQRKQESHSSGNNPDQVHPASS